MGRKPISKTTIDRMTILLKSGYTSKQVSNELKISIPTVNNYKAKLVKQNILEGRRVKANNKSFNPSVSPAVSKPNVPSNKITTNFRDFSYVVDGSEVIFKSRPKKLIISKKEMHIEF